MLLFGKLMKKLVIFDLDGTMLNTIDDLANSCNYILKKYNLPIHSVEKYKTFVGNGVKKLIERALPKEKINEEFVEKLHMKFVEYYSQHFEEKTVPYEGILKLLKDLSKKEVKLAVASNKFNSATRSLVKKYFREFEFSSVLGQREGIPIKPNPQIVYDVMNESDIIDKQEVIFVGDSGEDMKTATNAGIDSIGVLWGFRSKEELKENGAKHIVEKPENILDILLD